MRVGSANYSEQTKVWRGRDKERNAKRVESSEGRGGERRADKR